MPVLNEAEIQVLIAAQRTAEAQRPLTREALAGRAGDFCRYLVDWQQAFDTLAARELLVPGDGGLRLTERGAADAHRLAEERPEMWYWYRQYYEVTRDSPAHAAFCERVYGRNLCQHGFADMAQLDKLIEVSALGPGDRALDLGCGNGLIAEYISDRTGAHVTGIDDIPEAIAQAHERTRAKRSRLAFEVHDMARLESLPGPFDTIISIDTLYFVKEDEVVPKIKSLLAPGGRIAILWNHSLWDPATNWRERALTEAPPFPRESLQADKTPMAARLRRLGLAFQAWDLTEAHYQHALRRQAALADLRADFEAEGNQFLYQNRLDEANGERAILAAGLACRYLYLAK